jgi:putative hydrolase of the HAD superfamily
MRCVAMPESPKVISFDLDGTLIDLDFDLYLWFEQLPRLYSEQNGIPLEKAKEYFRLEYNRIGMQRREWYDLCYWIKHHNLRVDPKKVASDLRHKITVFPDALPVLKKLKSEKRRMIVFSNTPKMFLDIKIKVDGLDGFFERAISVYSDYSKIKSYDGVFAQLADELGVEPCEILHVGDSYESDYVPAIKEGCAAILLDRNLKYSKMLGDVPPLDKNIRRIASLYEIEKSLAD